MSKAKATTSTLIPCLRYRDAPEAIDWLCRAFGFEKHLVVPGAGDTIAHAELRFGNGMIMLGSAGKHGGSFDRHQKTVAEVGGVGTQSSYVIVDDVDAHLEMARAAGAEIAIDIEDADHGRGYSCLDLEGNLWSFGSYDPWAT
jgi:uncharacterized glyoxalase superfamily protein PhnB